MQQRRSQATHVHSCGNCKRLLYHEQSLKSVPNEQNQTSGTGGPTAVEAVNGGAV